MQEPKPKGIICRIKLSYPDNYLKVNCHYSTPNQQTKLINPTS